MLVIQLCPTVRDLMDCSPAGSSVHGILQEEYWSGLPFPPPGDLPDPGIEPKSLMFPALAGGFFTTSATLEAPKIIAALFTIAKVWEQPKCPSTDEWIKKM